MMSCAHTMLAVVVVITAKAAAIIERHFEKLIMGRSRVETCSASFGRDSSWLFAVYCRDRDTNVPCGKTHSLYGSPSRGHVEKPTAPQQSQLSCHP
jgi:hypothetical protein